MLALLHRSDKFVKVYNKSSKIPPSNSVHFAAPLRRSRVFRLGWTSRKFTGACSIQNAIIEPLVSYIDIYFIDFAIRRNPRINIKPSLVWRFKQLDLGNNLELETCSYESFSSQWPILLPPIILTFSSESPCIWREPGEGGLKLNRTRQLLL
jgi:hypothetical protein